ncbi:PadR family transcriptional regulator [Streptomyces sp. NPDC048338]|uniref:PadR family transcriptional regulator n=1 Tax=Streptomyces sp. NPDC048338 TaxID=3365536 RepID=UPI00371DC487
MPEARLTTPSFLVLGIVDKPGEASPYDVKVEAARTVAPFWSMPHAQVYTQCDRLLEAGLFSETRQSGGRNRRLMRLTDAGRAALRGWLDDPAFVPVEARERGILKLWFGARPQDLAPCSSTSTAAPWPPTRNSPTRWGNCSPRGSGARWSKAAGS